MVRDDAPVGDPRPNTRDYTEEARERLGLAVVRAREAAGHAWRPSFAAATGVSVRSLLKLETGKPVGPSVYEAVARALPGWTEDTPRLVLEGADPPDPADGTAKLDTSVPRGGKYGELFTDDDVGTDEWIEFYAEFPEVVKAGIDVRRKRRELEFAEKLVAKIIAERAVPHEVGDSGR